MIFHQTQWVNHQQILHIIKKNTKYYQKINLKTTSIYNIIMNVYPTYNCNNTNLILKRNPPKMKQNR